MSKILNLPFEVSQENVELFLEKAHSSNMFNRFLDRAKKNISDFENRKVKRS